jgi:hypothetical protein
MQDQEILSFKNETFRLAQESDVANIRQLVNLAYKELADILKKVLRPRNPYWVILPKRSET